MEWDGPERVARVWRDYPRTKGPEIQLSPALRPALDRGHGLVGTMAGRDISRAERW